MADVRIAHLRKRYRMPSNAVSDRPRFDRVLQSALDDELFHAALERAGIPGSEEICIRRVASAVRLVHAETDGRLAVAWSIALADAIAERVRNGGPDVVRYRSRYLALVDMAAAATRGELERAWAWRSLGIWRGGEALDVNEARLEVIAQLARAPRIAPAVLSAVAKRGLLSLLVASVPAERWVAAARASLMEFGASESVVHRLLVDWGRASEPSEAEESAADVAASRILAASALARSVAASESVAVAGGTLIPRALAVLAMLECEPSLAAMDRAVVVVKRLARRMTSAAASPTTDSILSPGDRQNSRDARVADEAEMQAKSERPRDELIEVSIDDDVRERASTAWGGLLFLLHIIGELDLPTTLSSDAALAARPLRWSLHQLALLLVPVGEDDPAALAFAGVAPRTRAPSSGEAPPTDDEFAALRRSQTRIAAALRRRMNAAADETDIALVQRVSARNAEVMAEPAWIEIRLANSEVSTEVRRAGLDLDPGWIPWLGVVVRFAYV